MTAPTKPVYPLILGRVDLPRPPGKVPLDEPPAPARTQARRDRPTTHTERMLVNAHDPIDGLHTECVAARTEIRRTITDAKAWASTWVPAPVPARSLPVPHGSSVQGGAVSMAVTAPPWFAPTCALAVVGLAVPAMLAYGMLRGVR